MDDFLKGTTLTFRILYRMNIMRDYQKHGRITVSYTHLMSANADWATFSSDYTACGKLPTKSIFQNFPNLSDVYKRQLQNLFGTEKFDAVVNLAAQAGVRYSIENPYVFL